MKIKLYFYHFYYYTTSILNILSSVSNHVNIHIDVRLRKRNKWSLEARKGVKLLIPPESTTGSRAWKLRPHHGDPPDAFDDEGDVVMDIENHHGNDRTGGGVDVSPV